MKSSSIFCGFICWYIPATVLLSYDMIVVGTVENTRLTIIYYCMFVISEQYKLTELSLIIYDIEFREKWRSQSVAEECFEFEAYLVTVTNMYSTWIDVRHKITQNINECDIKSNRRFLVKNEPKTLYPAPPGWYYECDATDMKKFINVT